MRVFVLGTGRCGTVSFAQACGHLANFTVGHETRAARIGAARVDYPDQHIEADNRLTWVLAQLGRRYPNGVAADGRPETFWVHLRRDREATAQSFLKRWDSPSRASVIRAFGHGLVMKAGEWAPERRIDVCRYYVDTVTATIEEFLVGRPSMTIWLHEAKERFPAFLDAIGAEGDLAAAIAEWDVAHNASA